MKSSVSGEHIKINGGRVVLTWALPIEVARMVDDMAARTGMTKRDIVELAIRKLHAERRATG